MSLNLESDHSMPEPDLNRCFYKHSTNDEAQDANILRPEELPGERVNCDSDLTVSYM